MVCVRATTMLDCVVSGSQYMRNRIFLGSILLWSLLQSAHGVSVFLGDVVNFCVKLCCFWGVVSKNNNIFLAPGTEEKLQVDVADTFGGYRRATL